jgi:hypothetical protein
MAPYDVNHAKTSNMGKNVPAFSVDSVSLDGVQDQDETTYLNPKATQYMGYYKKVPEVKITIDTRSIWTIGNEIKSDSETEVLLDHIDGFGKDTFRNILKNMIVMRRVCGDSFAEIIRHENGMLLNLKPLDPSKIRIVVNRKGRIVRYEELAKADAKEAMQSYKPDQIFHLTNKRVGNEIHGVSDIEALEKIILANGESFDDFQVVMHRNVVPLRVVEVDLDNETAIATLAAKYETLIKNKEVLFIPKGTMQISTEALSGNATMNPLPWREHLKNYFFQVVGIPQIILGSSGEFTESTAKIAYVAFQQSVKDEQKDIMEQIFDQLDLKLELAVPTEIRNELLSDSNKDGQDQQTSADMVH